MSAREVARWRGWADLLRQEMMRGLTPQVTKSVDAIIEETGTEKSRQTMHSHRFWKSCQAAQQPHDTLARAGFDIEFAPTETNEIQTVTLSLNKTWRAILQRALDRGVKQAR